MAGAVVHSDVPQLGVQGEGARRRRHGCDLPQRLGGSVSAHGFVAVCSALRLRHGPPRCGNEKNEFRVFVYLFVFVYRSLDSSLLRVNRYSQRV